MSATSSFLTHKLCIISTLIGLGGKNVLINACKFPEMVSCTTWIQNCGDGISINSSRSNSSNRKRRGGSKVKYMKHLGPLYNKR